MVVVIVVAVAFALEVDAYCQLVASQMFTTCVPNHDVRCHLAPGHATDPTLTH